MDNSNILIEYGSVQREDVEVDYGDGGDDDSHWVPAIGMCFFLCREN